MSDAPDWIDGRVKEPQGDGKRFLRPAQEARLLRLTAILRDDVSLLEQVVWMKRAIAAGDYHEAKALWWQLSFEEKMTIWVAPKYGGIFTVEERKILKAPATQLEAIEP